MHTGELYVCVCVCKADSSPDCWLNYRNGILNGVSVCFSGWENSSHTSTGVLYHTISCLITLCGSIEACSARCVCVWFGVFLHPWLFLRAYKHLHLVCVSKTVYCHVWNNVEASRPDCPFIIMPSVVRPWRVQRHGSDERTGQESDSAQRMALSLGTHPKVRRASRPENQSGQRGHFLHFSNIYMFRNGLASNYPVGTELVICWSGKVWLQWDF